MKPEIRLDASVLGRLSLGCVWIEGVRVRERDPALEAELAAFGESLKQRFSKTEELREKLAPARRLYRAFGIEPTRRRPSSEALVRRVLKGKGLYRINTVVDVCNWCSMDFALPIGLYDVAKIEGDVVCRVGEEGEGYAGIGKEWVNVAGRITLADARGPFGNPSSDSARTGVDLHTQSILFVVFAPADFPRSGLEGLLEKAASRMLRFNGGTVLGTTVLGTE